MWKLSKRVFYNKRKIKQAMNKTVIDDFEGEYRYLSNFYPSPIEWNKRTWPAVEHAYQAAKSLLQYEKDEIRTCGPREATSS